MLKIRRPLGRLIFNMGIAIPGKTVFLIETAPWWFVCKNYIPSFPYLYHIRSLLKVSWKSADEVFNNIARKHGSHTHHQKYLCRENPVSKFLNIVQMFPCVPFIVPDLCCKMSWNSVHQLFHDVANRYESPPPTTTTTTTKIETLQNIPK